MLLLSLNTVIGFVGGAVTAVLSTKVYAWVRKQITSVENKVQAPIAAVTDAVKSAVDSVEKKL